MRCVSQRPTADSRCYPANPYSRAGSSLRHRAFAQPLRCVGHAEIRPCRLPFTTSRAPRLPTRVHRPGVASLPLGDADDLSSLRGSRAGDEVHHRGIQSRRTGPTLPHGRCIAGANRRDFRLFERGRELHRARASRELLDTPRSALVVNDRLPFSRCNAVAGATARAVEMLNVGTAPTVPRYRRDPHRLTGRGHRPRSRGGAVTCRPLAFTQPDQHCCDWRRRLTAHDGLECIVSSRVKRSPNATRRSATWRRRRWRG